MDVIESGYLSRYGSEEDPAFKHKVVTFERELASSIGVRHAVATCSGTGSLICCLAALGIGAGDEVIVPGYTFIASISSIIMSNAIPVLTETDESLTIDPEDIEKRITPRTKAIMPVHMQPKTDAILDGAVNISVGVVDKGLGSGFGININSSDAEVRAVGDNLAKLIRSL